MGKGLSDSDVVTQIGIIIKDRDRASEKSGFPLIQKGEYQGGRYAYVDTKDTFKTIVELLENDL